MVNTDLSFSIVIRKYLNTLLCDFNPLKWFFFSYKTFVFSSGKRYNFSLKTDNFRGSNRQFSLIIPYTSPLDLTDCRISSSRFRFLARSQEIIIKKITEHKKKKRRTRIMITKRFLRDGPHCSLETFVRWTSRRGIRSLHRHVCVVGMSLPPRKCTKCIVTTVRTTSGRL